MISFLNSCCSFNLDFFRLVASVAISDVGYRVGIFFGNSLILKFLTTFSLALNNNP